MAIRTGRTDITTTDVAVLQSTARISAVMRNARDSDAGILQGVKGS